MKDLCSLVKGYLESAGYRMIDQDDHVLVFDKLVFGQDRDTVLVWTMPEGRDIGSYEPILRAHISKQRARYPDAKAYVLAHSRGGFSRDMLQTLADNRTKFLVPIQFFDTAFRHEETGKVSAIADIRTEGKSERRVPQPFSMEPLTGQTHDKDIFACLLKAIARPEKPVVRLVIGRAGMGKTYLFRALFARLYDDFLEAKAKHGARPRPIPLTPDYRMANDALRMRALIDNFVRSEVAASVPEKAFEWLLVNGFSTWLFDGLDELYAGDQEFCDDILELVTRPGSLANITILCRDSVITTSGPFAEFRSLCTGSDLFEIYRLADWDRRAKRHLAWLHLEGRDPQRDEAETGKVASFMKEVDRSPAVQSLSGLPFYCYTLLDLFEKGQRTEFTDDVALLNYVVDEMIKREKDKGLLDTRMFDERGLEEWIELMAVTYIEESPHAGITRDHASEYARLVLRQGLDEDSSNQIMMTLLRFPLFQAGSETGLLVFTHDLIAQALGARAYIAQLIRNPAETGRRLSRTDLEDPVILRFIAKRMGNSELTRVLEELRRGGLQDRALCMLLSLAMIASPDRDLVRRSGVNLESQNLVGVRFKDRDLSGLSFRRADLSHAVFEDCDLRSVHFEGAFLDMTRFAGKNDMEKAMFGDLSRVESVWVGNRLIEDSAKIRDWVETATRTPSSRKESCPTALQMRHLFGKFITPLGDPRRDQLGCRGLLAGKQIAGAASSQECLDQAISGGYLTKPDFRERCRRAEGDKYAEMVKFVRDGSVSDELGRVLARLCRRRACLHQLRHE